MKKRIVILPIVSLAAIATFAFSAIVSSKTRVDKTKAVPTPVTDHFMAAFNSGAITTTSISGEMFRASNADPTSDVTLKFSSGSYTASKDYIKLGRDSETASTSAAASIAVSTDEDFVGVWNAVSAKYSSHAYVNAVITEQYISNIQDIAMTWKYVEDTNGNACFVYQLEDEDSWRLLLRDDGEDGVGYWSYPLRKESNGQSNGTGTSGTYNRFAAYSASHNGTAEPNFHGTYNDFSKNLRGKTARIGFVYSVRASDKSSLNYMQLGSFMINRSKSIKYLVNAVESGTVADSGDYYNRLVDMGGHKMLQSHANSLIEEHNSSTYYAAFDTMYTAYSGAGLGFTPVCHDVTLYYESTDTTFTYDGLRHEPTFYFLDESNHSIYLKWNATYSSDVSGYNSTKAPKDPFYYAAIFEIDEPYAFNYTGEQTAVVFHIDEASDGSDFLADWSAARTAGGLDGMCDMLSTPEKQAELDILIKRYNNNFSNEVKATIGSTTDDGDYTIADSIAYFTSVLNGETHTENYGANPINDIKTSSGTILVAIISSIAVCSFFAVVVILKKKKHN